MTCSVLCFTSSEHEHANLYVCARVCARARARVCDTPRAKLTRV